METTMTTMTQQSVQHTQNLSSIVQAISDMEKKLMCVIKKNTQLRERNKCRLKK